jgi:hypothetical protein
VSMRSIWFLSITDLVLNRFRQSHSADFLGDNHITRNRLLYPDMTAQIRTDQGSTRFMNVQANVSGFVLDLDSSIADYVFSLVDVYRHGKERVDRLAGNNLRVPPTPDERTKSSHVASDSQYSALPTSNAVLRLNFQSGTLRMHSGPTRSMSAQDSIGVRAPASGVATIETFFLPMLTVWGEYRATPALQKLSGAKIVQPSTLMFKATVHSSENTLRPSLLPFVSELVNKVELRLREASKRARPQVFPATPTTPARDFASVASELSSDDSPVSSLQMTFALRIDQSKLQLTCQPDVNVVAGVHWDSGGFLINVSPGANQVSLMANVSGLTIGLKHGFLSEDCVRLDARNLAFSTTFSNVRQEDGRRLSYVSITVDTGVAGGVKFSRLQDVFCFKAVWLDRIPVFTTGAMPQGSLEVSTPQKLKAVPIAPSSSSTEQDLVTIVLVRVRSVELDADLGQSITNLHMDMRDVVLRTKLEGLANTISLDIGDLTLSASGNISGKARIPDFTFRTVRRKHMERHSRASKMLELYMTSGTMDLTLESDYQKILQLWCVTVTLPFPLSDSLP